MKQELIEKFTNAHTVLMQVKTCGDDSIAMAQGLLLLREGINTANRLPEQESESK